jgi:hypothetical protein
MCINQLKHVETSNPIDLATWGAFTLTPKLGRKITELIQTEFNRSPPTLSFPFGWATGDRPGDGGHGPPPDDPVMLYVDLPLGANEGGCVYACSLEAVVDDLIELHESGGKGGKIEGVDACEMAGKVATRLRELADKLDAACAP